LHTRILTSAIFSIETTLSSALHLSLHFLLFLISHYQSQFYIPSCRSQRRCNNTIALFNANKPTAMECGAVFNFISLTAALQNDRKEPASNGTISCIVTAVNIKSPSLLHRLQRTTTKGREAQKSKSSL